MANELDKFTLEYSVQLSDSISRLEKLQKQMGKVEETSKNTAKGLTGELKGALDGLANSFGGLDGPLARVITRFGALGGAASVAGAAVLATLAIAAKGIRDMNAMSDLSNKTGIGTLSLENIQRNMAASSGGRVSREMTQDTLTKFSEAWKRAYVDPTGKERLAFSTMGINPTTTGPNAAFGQAAEWMKNNQGRAQGIGQQFGFDYKATGAMIAGGASITNLAMTPEQVNDHVKAQEAADHVNKFIGDLNESLKEFSFEAADHVINALRTIGHWFGTASEGMARAGAIEGGIDPDAPKTQAKLTPEETKQAAEKKAEADKQKQAAQTQIDAADQAALAQAKEKAQWDQILALFGSSVNKFSQAVDLSQALAAWAGEAGKAAGLPGSSNTAQPGANARAGGNRGLRNNNPGNLEYGEFAKAHGATGSDGRFAIFASPEAGTAAHEALLRSAYLAKGLNTPSAIIRKYAPANENDQAAYLAFLKSKGFDRDAAITGDNLKAFVAAQEAYESGYGSGHGIGESRSKMNNRSVQETFAGFLGVPLEQIQRGKVSRGDAQFAMGQTEIRLLNSFNATKLKLKALDEASASGSATKEQAAGYAIQRGQLQTELREQVRALDSMSKYGQSVVDRQMAGDRTFRTLSQQGTPSPINISINGVSDPKAIAEEVRKVLLAAFSDAVAMNATALKR
jgi:hypothetical protein